MLTVDHANPLIRESWLNQYLFGRWIPLPGAAQRARAHNVLNHNQRGGSATGGTPSIGRGRGPWPAWSFAGSGGYFSIPTITLGTQYSLFAMASPSGSPLSGPVLGSARFGLMYLNAGLFFHDSAGAELVSVSYSFPTDGTWVGLGVVRSGASVKFFVNGVQQGATQTLVTTATTASTLSSIGETNGGGIVFSGQVQDVLASKIALSDRSMRTLYLDAVRGYHRSLRRVDWNWYGAGSIVPWHLFGVSA